MSCFISRPMFKGFLAVLCQVQGLLWNRFPFSPNPNTQPTQAPRTQPPNLAAIWGQSARQPFAQFNQMSMPGQRPTKALPNQGLSIPGSPNSAMPNPGSPNPAMPNQGMPNPAMANPGMPNQANPNPAMPNQGMPPSGMPNRGMLSSGMPSSGMPKLWLTNTGMTNQAAGPNQMPGPGMPKLWLANAGMTDQAAMPNQMPSPGMQRLGMPSHGMSNQALMNSMNLRMESQGTPAMAMCVPTFYQPQLCTLNGENQHQYTLQSVMSMLRDKNIEKVPACIRGIQKVNCGDYNAAQTIWKKGYCYCKRYHNNLSRYAGMPPLRCVLNACGACTQEFYIGRNRFVDCD